MKGELKAGGLALVVRSTDACDVGKCVTLLQLLQPGESFTSPDGLPCHLKPEYPPAWLVVGEVITSDDRTGKIMAEGWAIFPPENLLPIDGDDDQEPQEREADKPREVVA